MKLSSPAFAHEGTIPRKHTCEGSDVSPELRFAGVPPSAKSLALVVDDPDAPDPKAPQRTWVHWVVYNLPPVTRELAEAATPPAGSEVGRNDWDKTAWGGPCPPVGRHRYFFKLYALDVALPRGKAFTKSELVREMRGHVLAEATLVGTYAKGD